MANWTYDDYLKAQQELAAIPNPSWVGPSGYSAYDEQRRQAGAKVNSVAQYLQSGAGQVGQAMAQLGLSGGAPTSQYTPDNNIWLSRVQGLLDNPDSIQNSAAYKFRFNEGQRALERGAAAKGMLNSGNTLTALLNYGQGAASQEYNNQLGAVSDLYKTVEGANASRYGADIGGQSSNKNALIGLYGMTSRNSPTTTTSSGSLNPFYQYGQFNVPNNMLTATRNAQNAYWGFGSSESPEQLRDNAFALNNKYARQYYGVV